ncbi:TPA: hypothetical protein N3282_004452 [Klebsiella aerogenes]|nr:hypothetical protein [Klebsiella aerogenes]
MSHPHILLTGDIGIWGHGIPSLTSRIPVEVILVSEVKLPYQLRYRSGLRGVVHIYAGKGPCPQLVKSLVEIQHKTQLPQLVLGEQLEDILRLFPGVRVESLYAPLEKIRKSLKWVISGVPQSGVPSADRKSRFLPLPMLQAMQWLNQGQDMTEIARRWNVPVSTAYSRYRNYRNRNGLNKSTEHAAVCGMADLLIGLYNSVELTDQTIWDRM